MPATLPQVDAAPHQNRLPDRFRRRIKADLKNVQKKLSVWADDAADCRMAISLARLSRKEAAARLDLTESQLSAQLAGAERPQTERWRADDVLRGPYLIAQAMRHPELFDVVTTISIKRTA